MRLRILARTFSVRQLLCVLSIAAALLLRWNLISAARQLSVHKTLRGGRSDMAVGNEGHNNNHMEDKHDWTLSLK